MVGLVAEGSETVVMAAAAIEAAARVVAEWLPAAREAVARKEADLVAAASVVAARVVAVREEALRAVVARVVAASVAAANVIAARAPVNLVAAVVAAKVQVEQQAKDEQATCRVRQEPS